MAFCDAVKGKVTVASGSSLTKQQKWMEEPSPTNLILPLGEQNRPIMAKVLLQVSKQGEAGKKEKVLVGSVQ